MVGTPSAKTSFRLSALAHSRLTELAKQHGRTRADYVELLIHKAWDDPDGYYLRATAIQSYVSTCLANIFLDLWCEHSPEMTARRDQLTEEALRQSVGLFGAFPPRPLDLPAPDGVDPRVAALMAAFSTSRR